MFRNSRANKSALHPCNQFIVDKFIQLERQQQMRGSANLNYTYSKIIKSLQKYPLPILSRQQALSLESVGDKMANLIYGLIKTHYKDYIINQNQEFEEALQTDSEDGTRGRSKNQTNQNSRSNSECSSKNSSNLFSRPGNTFSSKLLTKKDKDEDADIPKDFKGIKNTIKNSNKKKPTADEEELCKKNGQQKIISLLSEDEQQEVKIGKDNTLFNILSQYITPDNINQIPQTVNNEQPKESKLLEEMKNRYDKGSIIENKSAINIEENNDEFDQKIAKMKESFKNNQSPIIKTAQNNGLSGLKKASNDIIIEEDKSIIKNKSNQMVDEREEEEEDALHFQKSILTSFQYSSKNKAQKQQQISGGMKKIMVDSDQESTLPQNKESSSSSKKSSVKPSNGNVSYLSDSEEPQIGLQTQENSKKKRKFNPKEHTNNWAILISMYCLKEEYKKNFASTKDIKQRAKSISEEIDHQFIIKNFSQIDSLINNDLIIMSILQGGEKHFTLTSAGIEMAQNLYQKFVAKSLAGIQENSQENATSQKQKGNNGINSEMEEEVKVQTIESKLGQVTSALKEIPQLNLYEEYNNNNFEYQEYDNSYQNFMDQLERYDHPQQKSRTQVNWQNSRTETEKVSSIATSVMNIKKIEQKVDKFEENFSDRNSDYEYQFQQNDNQSSQNPSILNTQGTKKTRGNRKEKKVIEPLQSKNIFKEVKGSSLSELDDDDIENEAINNSLPFSSNRSIPLQLQYKPTSLNQKFQEKLQTNSIAKGMIKEYEVILIIDVRERTDKNERMLAFKQKLDQMNVNCKVENIYLGDFLWVVDITTIDGVTETYVLDYVIERKTGDDFASSIQDHRYKEQKYRYKKSGLKHCYYLVEGEIKNNRHLSVSQSTIETAIMSTQIIEQFKVQRTKSFQESIQWISFMHKNILSHFNEYITNLNEDHIIKFQYTMAEYQKQNKKNGNLNLKEQFGHILRSITGSGPQQVQILTEIFETPINLISHLGSQRNLQERIELIIDQTKLKKTNLKAQGFDSRIIQKSLATSIAILFGEERYPKDKVEDG